MMQPYHSSGNPGQADQKPDPLDHPEEISEPGPEIGGRGGLEPTRYGDWEKNGRCIDF
jgi:hypothetical protein